LKFLNDPELNDLGAGYWFWKAPLLEHHMNQLEEGDFVVFNNLSFGIICHGSMSCSRP
jgi:hypothetical protein